MPKYDKQLIVQVDMDWKAGENRVNLEAKAQRNDQESATVRINPMELQPPFYGRMSPDLSNTLRQALGNLTPNSRLYIVGHGDWKSQRVGDVSGPTLAKLLFDHGLRHARGISLVACEAGRDKLPRSLPGRGKGGSSLLGASADSFASKFHYALCVVHDLNIDVVARTMSVATLDKDFGCNVGRKYVQTPTGDILHKATGSKVRFTMRGSQQVREVVEYESTVMYPNDQPALELMWNSSLGVL